MYIPITLTNKYFEDKTYYIGKQYTFVIKEGTHNRYSITKGTLDSCNYRRGCIGIAYKDHKENVPINLIEVILSEYNDETGTFSKEIHDFNSDLVLCINDDFLYLCDSDYIANVVDCNKKIYNIKDMTFNELFDYINDFIMK